VLKIVLGSAGTGKSRYVFDRIAELMRAPAPENKAVLIVPEQASMQCERDLAELIGNKVGAWCEVVSLRRLAQRIFSQSEGAAGQYADHGASLLAMSRALHERGEELSVLSAVVKKPDYLEKLLNAVNEIKTYGLTAGELNDAALEVEGGLSEKLRDMGKVLESYDRILLAGFKDPSDDMTRLCAVMDKYDPMRGRTVFIDGFSGFTPTEMGVIERLIAACREVTVTLCLPDDRYDDENGVFAATLETKRAVEAAAFRCGVKKETVVLDRQWRLGGELELLGRGLFSPSAAPFEGQTDRVRLHYADSVFTEVEFAASFIAQKVREQGLRYRDFLLITRDMATYGPLVDAVFSRHGLPVYIDRRHDIMSRPEISAVLGALDAVQSGFSYESMFRYAKTGLCGLTRDECDILENYVILWSVRDGKWEKEFKWHPDGMTTQFDDGAKERLEAINVMRERLISPLTALKKAADGEKTAAEFIAALYAFMRETGLAGQIDKKRDRSIAEGDEDLAMQYEQLWSIICSVLDQMTAVCGTETMDIGEFSSLMRLTLSGYDIGTIPTSLDEVLLGGAQRVRPHEARYVLILGANDGILPMSQGDDGFFSDDDKRRLGEIGLKLSPTTQGQGLLEKFFIYTSVTCVTDGVVFCCPRTGADGDTLNPSYIVSRVKKLFPRMLITDDRTSTAFERSELPDTGFDNAAGYLGAQSGGDEELTALYRYFSKSEKYRYRLARIKDNCTGRSFSVADRELLKRRYGDIMYSTASRVEKFYSCRFAYFMQYGLRARRRESVKFSEPEIGAFIHAVLEEYLKEVKLSGRRMDELDRKHSRLMVRRIVRGYIENTFGDMSDRSNRFKYLFNRLCRTLYTVTDHLAEEFADCDFEPLEFELDVGGSEENSVKALDLTDERGNRVRIVGKVDRIDGYTKDGELFVRVVDYKTGGRVFSFGDVMSGLGMQMLIYLFAVCGGGEEHFGARTKPAGVLYLHVYQPIISAPKTTDDEEIRKKIEKSLKMNGLVLSDREVIRAMERDIGDVGRFIPVKVKNDEPCGAYVASAAQFRYMRVHVERMLKRMAADIADGDVRADPYVRPDGTGACTFCEFREACLFDRTRGDRYRRLGGVSVGDFWSRIGQEVEPDGKKLD